jgi:hypothetical protein
VVVARELEMGPALERVGGVLVTVREVVPKLERVGQEWELELMLAVLEQAPRRHSHR